MKGILHIRSYACCKYVGVKMTGGPKKGQPRPPNISSPVKPFRDEASKFGALWGYKHKLRSGHE